MSQAKLLNELGSNAPLRPETFARLFVEAELITNQNAHSVDLTLAETPFFDDTERDPATIVGRNWTTTPVPRINPEATVGINTYYELGSSLATEALPDDRLAYGRLLGHIAFGYEASDGHFSGRADFMSQRAILLGAEWYLTGSAKRTNVSIGHFAGKLGLGAVWRTYANDEENLGIRMSGEFPVGQGLGTKIIAALQSLSKL